MRTMPGSDRFEVAVRRAERARDAFRTPLYVIPYNAPWYELLLSGVLTIKTESGRFGVKTGSTPRRYRGWVGFYNSKGRVRKEVVERHVVNRESLNLGMLVGVGYLADSRELTPAEQYQWYLRANSIDDVTVDRLYRRRVGFDPKELSTDEKVEFLENLLHDFSGDPVVIAGPAPIGHFYLPDSLKRFPTPLPIKYPPGAVTGTTLAVTPEIRKAIREAGVALL